MFAASVFAAFCVVVLVSAAAVAVAVDGVRRGFRAVRQASVAAAGVGDEAGAGSGCDRTGRTNLQASPTSPARY